MSQPDNRKKKIRWTAAWELARSLLWARRWRLSFGLLLIGLALAPIFPGLMSRTPQRLGAYSVHAIGFQVSAAMAGAALLPSLVGLGVQRFGLGLTPVAVVVLACVLLLLHESLMLGIKPPVA